MTPFKDKLDRLEHWVDADNARQDVKLRERPVWWHLGKTLFGGLLLMKSYGIAKHADGLDGFALAALICAAGITLVFQGIRMLRPA
jgi:hypothetical protein